MLKLKNICKDYITGDSVVHALSNVSISFRKSEFVAVLGASGCGKTTMLNIIGGLDRYSSGDLVIGGKSTKDFSDRDWDNYRNHSVGFVFQSYNLIPHQTVLANVELALTLSGVSKAERKKRAVEALEKVGLGDQLRKKPAQMSGGQMQRVAIARALVNDPEIILADEPTGALDSETSVQVMDILKEISRDRLIIMVTHNPDLAGKYASRTVNLKDGYIVSDSMPFSEEDEAAETAAAAKSSAADAAAGKGRASGKKTSMSFGTALSLSLNNLLTKKTRTFLTSFAGSIGIIGIALILSLSNGIDLYIDKVQEDTLSTYPLTIESETMDMNALLTAMMGAGKKGDHGLDAVYSNPVLSQMLSAMSAGIKTNNLTDFKAFLDSRQEELESLILDLRYNYDVELNIFLPDYSDGVIQVNPSTLMEDIYSSMGITGTESMSSIATDMYKLNVWEEMLGNTELLNTQYDVIAGRMPSAYDEIVVVVNENNEISDMTLYTLGLLDLDELSDMINDLMNSMSGSSSSGNSYEPKWHKFEYDDILGLTYKVVLPTSMYVNNGDGTWTDMSEDEDFMKSCIDNGIELKVVGIIRPDENATATSISGSVAYTQALTSFVTDAINSSPIVQAQLADESTNVFTGLPFADPSDREPDIDDVNAFIQSLPAGERARYNAFRVLMGSMDYSEIEEDMASLDEASRSQLMLLLVAAGKTQDAETSAYMETLSEQELQNLSMMAAYFASMDDEKLVEYLAEDDEAFKAYLDSIGKGESEATYSGNLKLLGYTTPDSPSSISIYAKDFESKTAILELIDEYNASQSKENKISYTDYVGVLLDSVTTIVGFVSYALIAFVSISLVVSSIMIGIITYISVLERTKEIGILRSIGASKRDIARVFNAETLIVGLAAGVIGILFSLLLIIPINAVIYALGEVANIAQLPVFGAVGLVVISMALTFVAGLIPSRIAAKKDPVESLRSE